jgi:hypothetical protein
MTMRKLLGTTALSVALLLASGVPALAESSRAVNVSRDAVLNGTSLPAGAYTVRWQTHSPEATVEFVRHHKLVLSTEGKLESRDRIYQHDEIVYNTAEDGTIFLVEIRFSGSRNVLVFNR